MKAVLQRVSQASVIVNRETVAQIHTGLLVFLGIEELDNEEDIIWLCNKIIQLRIFDDAQKIPNLSLIDLQADLLLVSQFTLQASTKKGNRPSYIKAAKPTIAEPLYKKVITQLEACLHKKISTGIFGADMQVSLINDGPLTIIIDSKNKI